MTALPPAKKITHQASSAVLHPQSATLSSVVYVGVCLALALIILRGQSVSGYVVQANMWGVSRPLSQIRHRSELTERDWENAVQGLVNVGVKLLFEWSPSQTQTESL